MKKKLLAGKRLEYAVFALFVVLYCVITAFHEPWFDEAEAWQIAKCASLQEILFTIPHYEGHPPLWHLLLAIPAKLGVPFEIGLKSIGFLISCASAGLLLFRSRLPRPVRLSLPFSYFFFYQYGVIVRPYGLMLLVFLLLGMALPQRAEHPWRCFWLLLLLCLTSAYGILLAGGISLCILWELWREKGTKALFAGLFRDRQTMALAALLPVAVLLILEIRPRADTYATVFEDANPFWLCLICSVLTFPGECLLTTASWFSIDRTLLQVTTISAYELLILSAVGVILWILILCASSGKTRKYLILPYLLFAVFAAKVYFSGHHLGVVFCLLLFWAELVSRDEDRFAMGKGLMKRVVRKESDFRLLPRLYRVIAIFCLAVPLVWSAVVSVNELRYNYYYSRDTAAFLRETGLDRAVILAGWHENGSTIPQSEGDEAYVNTVMIGSIIPVNAYFQRNLSFALNEGRDDRAFLFHRRPSLEESQADLVKWRSAGPPEVIIGKPDLSLVYGDELTYEDYSLVHVVKFRFLWKTSAIGESIPVFLRKDLLQTYGLEPLTGLDYIGINGMPAITEEIRERFENGEPMEEILKPYLDAMFGEVG